MHKDSVCGPPLAVCRVYLVVMQIIALVWQDFYLQASNNKETTLKQLLVTTPCDNIGKKLLAGSRNQKTCKNKNLKG